MTFVETLGWVLLHFAWQGAVAAFLLWMALLVTPSGRASLRYALGCVALLLMATAPLATAIRLTASHVEPIAVQPREGGVAASLGRVDTTLEARERETSTFVPNVGADSTLDDGAKRRRRSPAFSTHLPWSHPRSSNRYRSG
jgi:hypothetical protein